MSAHVQHDAEKLSAAPRQTTSEPELCAAFTLPHCKVSRARGTLSLSGTVTLRTALPVDTSTLKLWTSGFALPATFTRIRTSAKRGKQVTRFHLSCELTMAQIEGLPIHSALRLIFSDSSGCEHLTSIRWIGALPKYLALKGPYLVDGERGLTAYFRQNVPKGTTLTVRHTNVTDAPAAHAKLVFAWAASKVAFFANPLIVFEKNARHYEESGRCVFEHLVDEGNDDVWFIIDRQVADALDVEDRYRKRFLYQHTFKHYLYFFRSTRFLGTEALGHAIELRCQSILTQRKTKSPKNRYVFMQHGVMYMVSLDSPERASFRKKNMPGKVRIVASSELEAKHFTDMAGFTRDDIIVCGLPKFDRSFMNPAADKILIMPTWRPWEFASMRVEAAQTSYVRMVNRIAQAIPEHLRDKVVVAPHPLFDPSLFALGSDKATQPQSYDELLRDVKLLITDYSSIAYDAFYRGANVVFYWEELEECMAHYGEPTHLMIDDETAFGPVCRSADELAGICERIYASSQSDEYRNRYQRIVEHHDGRNTQRLVEELKRIGVV